MLNNLATCVDYARTRLVYRAEARNKCQARGHLARLVGLYARHIANSRQVKRQFPSQSLKDGMITNFGLFKKSRRKPAFPMRGITICGSGQQQGKDRANRASDAPGNTGTTRPP